MKWPLAFAAVFVTIGPAVAQEAGSRPSLVDGLNLAIEEQSGKAGIISTTPAKTEDYYRLVVGEAPEWGVVIKDVRSDLVVDAFGQVNYVIEDNGSLVVPGFEPPAGTYLELVPAREWQMLAATLTTVEELDPTVAPLTGLPSIVEKATDYLAQEMCSTRSRPSSITLVLMVGASGNILFAEASTDAGSEVTWDLAGDVCPRYGIEPAPQQP